MTAGFDPAFVVERCGLEMDTGDREVLTSGRWRAEPDRVDELMLRRCRGPTLDVGCGPGRLTRALLARGAPALGVDSSRLAVRMTAERGGLAVLRSVFDPVPGEGRWKHVLLADGNLGIGGDPRALLARARQLLGPSGTAIVEMHPPGTGLRSGRARLGGGPWFSWAQVGIDAIETLAASVSMCLKWTDNRDGRWLAELGPPRQELD